MVWVEKVNQLIWGQGTILLLLLVGGLLTVCTGFFQFRKVGLIFKKTVGTLFKKKEQDGISPFRAMSAALAGTMGVGNIVGVATAITAGGAGAVFWMWMGACVGMMTKYAEVLLAVHYRRKKKDGSFFGGPMYYIEQGLKIKPLAIIFSIACVGASFGIGNMTQSNAITTSLVDSFQIPVSLTGILTACVVGLVILGGAKRITQVTAVVIPFMSIFYMAGAVFVLICHRSMLLSSFGTIFADAFSSQAAGGGVLGFLTAKSVSIGISRGIFTNEAGLGSAPIAHACSNTKKPVEQGMWGIFEVFADTLVVCTITALVILSTGANNTQLAGAAVTNFAFSTVFGSFGGQFVSIAILFFALASILSWSLYGQEALFYLSGGNQKAVSVYCWIFTGAVFIGGIAKMDTIWSIADSLNGLMLLPNIVAVLLLSRQVISLTKEYSQT